MHQYSAWRVGQKDYAIGLAIYFATYFAVFLFVSKTMAIVALPVIWIVTLAVPRLRDIGLSPWWSLAPFGAGFAAGVLNGLLAAATGQPSPIGKLLTMLVGLGSLVFMIWLGFKRSRPMAAEAFA